MDERCTVYKTLDIVGKKWSLLIILSIYKADDNRKRYSCIKKDLASITGKILSKRLKELEKEDLLAKYVDDSKIPVNTYYSLTESGKELIKIIKEIKRWGLRHKFKNDICKAKFCKNCGI